MIKGFLKGLEIALNSVGYGSFLQAFSHIFLTQSKMVTMIAFIGSIPLGMIFFLENWVYAPSNHLFIFSILIFVEGILGTIRATVMDKEKFDLDKSLRVIPKWMAQVFLLSSAWHLSESTGVYEFLPTSVFAFLTFINFFKIFFHFVMLKLVDKETYEMVKKKFSDNNIYDNKKNATNQ